MNPIHAARRVTSDFLKYQLTAFPFSDSRLYGQLRTLLRLDDPLGSPLMKGPYLSLSRAFRDGPTLASLAASGVVHPHIPIIFTMPHLRGHQETAIRAIHDRKHTVVSTGTGSGKTECFLIPIISHCLDLRDAGEPAGIRAVIVYPMNALAEDQLSRMRELLVGSGIPFAMYVGKTPEKESQVSGVRCGPSRDDYLAKVKEHRDQERNVPVLPPEEVASREKLRSPSCAPRILLTNVKMLELLLTRATDVELFEGARLDHLVVDEAHTFRGADGAEAALLMRRLRTYCGQTPEDTTCIATSATLADPSDPDPARTYMERFFGVDRDDVAVVSEDYQDDEWLPSRYMAPPMSEQAAIAHLENVLNALDRDETTVGAVLGTVYRSVSGRALRPGEWRERLFEDLLACENAYSLAQQLKIPCNLEELCGRVSAEWSRPVSPFEVLLWLSLGSAARRSERPLLRPVVHGFVRGIDGAVVAYSSGSNDPKLWLSTEDAERDEPTLSRLPTMTCTNCGLHYYPTWLSQYQFDGAQPTGGHASGDGVYWPVLEEAQGGCRAVLTDLLQHPGEEEGDGHRDHLPRGASPVDFCRFCGALNRGLELCGSCGRSELVPMLAVKMDGPSQPAKMDTCVSCGSGQKKIFGQLREPARPVRATAVSDVHVLSQNLLQHASKERKRLLVFTDSRQDAAFQAGWMRDHARRFRLRGIVDEILRDAPATHGRDSLGLDDIVDALGAQFDHDKRLSEALIPEVWEVAVQTPANQTHERERKDYLKLFLMREMAVQQRQKTGLEPWGRVRIRYKGLSESDTFIKEWAAKLHLDAAALTDGVAAVLDVLRRRYCLYDEQTRVFTRFIEDSDKWVQNLYIPTFDGAPQAIGRTKPPNATRVVGLTGPTGQSLGDRAAKLWGVDAKEHASFISDLWKYLLDTKVIRRIIVEYADGRRAPGFDDAYQIDSGVISLAPQDGLYRCGTCRKIYCRPLPQDRCLHYRCGGIVHWEPEDPDNYDLMTLRERYVMVRPREHSAQVPDEDREALEIAFKGDGPEVNTLVCTPTLELGVDIGALDSVLLRNVPPLPSNYWQRVGRAGRRHRIALNLTYARPVRHDRAYFQDPLKMLAGKVEAPRFNLRNPVMIRKHIHSVVLACLHRLARPSGGLDETAREAIREALSACLPPRISPLLFEENGDIRQEPKSVQTIQDVVDRYAAAIATEVRTVFDNSWPVELAFLISRQVIDSSLAGFGSDLGDAVFQVFRRLKWAQSQLERLGASYATRGALDREDEALRNRCSRVVKRLRGEESHTKSEGAGIDDSLTYAVLAAEGFLPGYGLTGGGIRGFADPFRAKKFVLGRSSVVGIREFVPGNLLYANNRRFYTSNFQLSVEGESAVRSFIVDTATETLSETAGAAGPGAQRLSFIPACDVDLQQRSLISDEEEMRFMMPVTVYGREEGVHGEGQSYEWGGKTLDWRPQLCLLLANIGEARLSKQNQMGYLICQVCGQGRSPYATPVEVRNFTNSHTTRCGRTPDRIGIYTRSVVDCLRLQKVTKKEACSVGEALRIGASRVLEMEVDDIEIAVIPAPENTTDVDLLLLDPMPGGSGLLQQMLEKWPKVCEAALEIVRNCPSQCGSSCVDCLQTYRNQQYHQHLHRHDAETLLSSLGDQLVQGPIIPARSGVGPTTGGTTNQAEDRLRFLLERVGLPQPKMQHRIELPSVSSHTVVDFFFESENEEYEGVCVYLDGLGMGAHGTAQQQERDRILRMALEGMDYKVVAIPASELNDRPALVTHFAAIARAIAGRSRAQQVRDSAESWWTGASDDR